MYRTLFTSKRTLIIIPAICISLFILAWMKVATPIVDHLCTLDKMVTMALNYDGGATADRFWHSISSNMAWVPLGTSLLMSLTFYKKSPLIPLLIITGVAVTITLTDQISASLIKPLFARLRPSHDPEICGMLHYVNNYKGGMFGFVSSHAANAFGVFAFLAPTFRYRTTRLALFTWSCMVCYSRIYLGVHFLGDVIGGCILGMAVGTCMSQLFTRLYFKLRENGREPFITAGLRHYIESSTITLVVVGTGIYMFFYSIYQSVPFSVCGMML